MIRHKPRRRYSRLARLLKLRVKEALAPRIEPQDRHRLGLSEADVQRKLRPPRSIQASPKRLLILGACGCAPAWEQVLRQVDARMEKQKFLELRDESGR